MNHYPRHVGDWMTATAHLTSIEECMYSRMVDQYYARESPLPLDVGACCRLVRAASAVERKAVGAMLSEFFCKEADGWHQKRCDEELAAYHARSESAKASAAASVEARRRHREANANGTLNDRSNERSTKVRANAKTNVVTNASTNVELTSNQNQNQKNGEEESELPTPDARPKARARKRAALTAIPPDFAVSDRVREWAADKGYTRLDERLEHFIGKALAKGYAYADWDAGFMGAIREDWAGLNGKPRGGGSPSGLSPAGQQTAANLAAAGWFDDKPESSDATPRS